MIPDEMKESLRMAMNAIRAHKLRSSLTLLGVLVGVFSIIVVMTAIRVMQKSVETELSGLGANTFSIQRGPGVYFGGPEGFEKFWRRKRIGFATYQKVKARADLPLRVGAVDDVFNGEVSSRFEQTPPNVVVLGATDGAFPAKNWNIDEGRALVEADVESARPVCVLGNSLARTLFPHSSPLGEQIKADGMKYTVVGVTEKKGSSLGGNQDNFVIIPLTLAVHRYGGWWTSVELLIQSRDQLSFDDTKEQVRGIMRAVRKVPPGQEDDFEILTNDSMIAQFSAFTMNIRIGAAVISSIALLAAGVGIMNIMLVSVTERTKEIGIRRAIGAKKRNILTQFIMEAIILCEVGGLMGVALGITGGNIAAVVLKVPPVIPVDWVIAGLFVCSLVGLIFGTYPAVKAANLDPIEALRYE